MGNVAFFCNGSARHAVQDNMRHVFGPRMSRWRLNQACRYVFRNTVKNYYDLLSLPKMKQTDVDERVTVNGAENIDEALKRGHGAIIFSGHIGNYNLVAQAATARGYPANIIAEQAASAQAARAGKRPALQVRVENDPARAGGRPGPLPGPARQ